LGRSAIREAPRNAIYLNVGQLGWAAPVATHWLQRRPDIRAVFMLHDVIPLQYPKLISFGGRMAQHWMLRAVISKAGGLIATTQAATETVKATLAARGLPAVPWATLHLPVDDVFLQQNTVDVGLTKHPYFVICGAIEPRKNHLLLLEVWQLLVRRLGRAAPRLVIIGSPAFSGHQILRQFYEAPSLQDHVIVLSGMASPSVRQAMANAKALLMPSLAEGFGLPVAEALAVGTPVLASDLPAHYEVGQDLATYLDPTDAVAWFDAIMELVEFDSKTSNLRQRISTYRPITQTSYFRSVQDFLLDLASNNCVART
jgi:glycosyltransferase involved in cell wall biosynthesis